MKKVRVHPLVAFINYRMDITGTSKEELASAIRMTPRNLQNRKNKPDMFQLGELERMAKETENYNNDWPRWYSPG